MGPVKYWTNKQIEPLSGDPLSGLDCTICVPSQAYIELNGVNLIFFRQILKTIRGAKNEVALKKILDALAKAKKN